MIDESAWIPIISVVIGSIIAYYGVNLNEERKRRFELKKTAYTDFLDILKEGILLYSAKAAIERQKTPEELEKDTNHEKNKKNLLIKTILWQNQYEKALIMIELCGSEKVVNIVFENIRILEEYALDSSNRYREFESSLIAAIREDLLGKSRWQLWK